MGTLCLSDDLLDAYLKFRFTKDFDKKTIAKLLKFLQPALVSKNQHSFFNDPSMASQLSADPIINLVVSCEADELVKQTTLKIQLVIGKNSGANFTQLDIQPISERFESLNMLLAGQHKSNENKLAAINHIKELLADAKFVKITDKYIATTERNWQQCKKMLEEILPKNELNPLRIITDNFKAHSDLKAICSGWDVKSGQIDDNIHDRYIETDKVIILLSSGLFHLDSSSKTDLTYIVKIKD